MNSVANNQTQGASIFSDLQSLNGIREQAVTDSRGAIKAAAKEFEAFFMNMMLKSMRQAGEVMGGDSLFGSQQEKMFIGMLDEQMSVELSQKGNLGIADLMARNLLGNDASLLNDGRPERIERAQRSIAYPVEVNPAGGKKNPPVNIEDIRPVSKIVENIVDENKKLDSGSLQTSDASLTDKTVKVEKKSLFENATDFINQLLPHAKKVAESIGLDPKLLLAQAALETGWGKYVMHDNRGQSSNNLFGIKTNSQWKGESVKIDTLEVENGEFVKTKDDFRMYENFEKSFSDYVNFLQSNPRYQAALNVTENAKDFVQSLQSAGYATDPNYANKILRIFETDMNSDQFGNAE